jgi:hypothetical protein
MKTVAISRHVTHTPHEYDISFLRRKRQWSTALLVSAIAGILTGMSGLVLAGAALLHIISPYGDLGILGTILLVVTFPLLIFQAHCLDKIEATNRAQKMANYKRLILTDPAQDLLK